MLRVGLVSTFAGLVFLATSVRAADTPEAAQRLSAAATVFSEIMATPDMAIPSDLLEKAHCAVVVPGVKQGAFIVGAKYGRGFITCRKATGQWSAPAGVRMEAGNVGFQIGGSESDLIMLVMNERGADRLMSTEFTLGGNGEVAAGPVGRSATAKTDAAFTAEMLSWSRSRGVFAGIALEGATLRQDKDANKEIYGSELSTKDIVRGQVAPPSAATELISLLSKYSPHEK